MQVFSHCSLHLSLYQSLPTNQWTKEGEGGREGGSVKGEECAQHALQSGGSRILKGGGNIGHHN